MSQKSAKMNKFQSSHVKQVPATKADITAVYKALNRHQPKNQREKCFLHVHLMVSGLDEEDHGVRPNTREWAELIFKTYSELFLPRGPLADLDGDDRQRLRAIKGYRGTAKSEQFLKQILNPWQGASEASSTNPQHRNVNVASVNDISAVVETSETNAVGTDTVVGRDSAATPSRGVLTDAAVGSGLIFGEPVGSGLSGRGPSRNRMAQTSLLDVTSLDPAVNQEVIPNQGSVRVHVPNDSNVLRASFHQRSRSANTSPVFAPRDSRQQQGVQVVLVSAEGVRELLATHTSPICFLCGGVHLPSDARPLSVPLAGMGDQQNSATARRRLGQSTILKSIPFFLLVMSGIITSLAWHLLTK